MRVQVEAEPFWPLPTLVHHSFTQTDKSNWANFSCVSFVILYFNHPIPHQMQRSTNAKGKRQRTFTGCRTCRRRRVKCDERKPTCRYCERLKLECEGYDALLQWLRPIESTRLWTDEEDEAGGSAEDQRQSRRQLFSGQPGPCLHPQ